MRNSLNPRSHMGCGGSKPPDATDASASDESFKDPTAAAEALENDAPPVSRSPGATSASEVAVSISDPGSSASAGAPATDWPSFTKGSKGEKSFNKESEGQAKRSLDERVAAHEAALQGRGSQGSRPGSRRLSAGTRRANSADFLAEPGTPELGRRKPRFVRLSFESARGKEIQARLDETHAAEAKATGSYKNRRASAPATVLKPLPEDKAEGSGRRSRRRSLGTLVSKKTEVEATEGEMVRKGKKGAAPPPPVKHSFEWE